MKIVLPTLISPEQFRFVSGREISDSILLAQEMVNSIDKKVRGHNVILKVDMIKAFDRVSWRFLSLLLGYFGFHPYFFSLVMNSLSSTWFSILVNRKPYGFFQTSH